MVKWRICNYVKLVLEKYMIILSLFLIIFGSYIIFTSFDRTLSNIVFISPISENQGYVNVGSTNSIYLFNPQNESAISEIQIGFEYKEPLACDDSLKINGIEILIKPGILKDVNLNFYLHGVRPYSNHVFNLDPKLGINNSRVTINEFRPFTFEKYTGYLMTSGQQSYENFEFFYELGYSFSGDIENKDYQIHGNATTMYPIRCMDYVSETNVSINKSLLRLTGIMIILGSFPFVISLKQLIEKEKK